VGHSYSGAGANADDVALTPPPLFPKLESVSLCSTRHASTQTISSCAAAVVASFRPHTCKRRFQRHPAAPSLHARILFRRSLNREYYKRKSSSPKIDPLALISMGNCARYFRPCLPKQHRGSAIKDAGKM
jgi:hypothetical protein